jgi:DNA-binding transcriptional regulator YdaS (Cro superfamily)
MQTPEDAWAHAKKTLINPSELAQALGLTRAAVHAWSKVPAERVIEIARLTGVRREVLRPDLYEPDPFENLKGTEK